MKYIQITTENNYVYRVPASVVADHRAEHYANNDPDTTFESEHEYTMSSDFELTDWFCNNMNWDDVEHAAELYESPKQDVPVIGQDEVEVIDET